MKRLVLFYKNLLLSKSDYIQSAFKWFGIAIVIGIVFFYYNESLLDEILDFFEDKFGENPALDINLAMQIFSQNLFVSGLAVIGGIVFGVIPFFIVASNGFILGYILHSLFKYSETGVINTLAFVGGGLIPHAILELPAFIIAAAFGISIGVKWMKKESVGQRFKVFVNEFRDGLILMPAIGVLLLVAAFIEVFVSGNLVK